MRRRCASTGTAARRANGPRTPATTSDATDLRASRRRLARDEVHSVFAALLADEPEVLQVLRGDGLGLLLVDVVARVELLHDLLGHVLLDVRDDRLTVRPELLRQFVAHREAGVVGREERLVV